MANTEKKSKLSKICDIWTNCTNPLRWFTKQDLDRMLSQMRYGNDSKLQQCFSQMEQTSPLFQICLNQRTAGIVNRKWDIVADNPEDPDSVRQADYIRKIFKRSDKLNEDGFTSALEKLVCGAFRGRGIVKPFIDDDLNLKWKALENWHVLRYANRLYWNPTGDQAQRPADEDCNLQEIPSSEVMCVSYERAIDICGILIYLRELVAEEKWAQSMESYGIPTVLLEAPEGTPETALDTFNYRAQAIFQGASGTLPSGTKVNRLDNNGSTSSFKEFADHQARTICILATGSTSAILGDVGSGLGSDVATKQDERFQSLVNQDSKKIENAINAVAMKKILKKIGEKAKCHFEFTEDDEVSAKEYLEMATALHNLGATIDIQKLKEMTKLPFIQDEVKDLWTPKKES